MGELWRHKTRGTTYEIITQDASLQFATCPEIEQTCDDLNFTVYRNVNTGAIYVRPTEEFMDGRFELASTPDLHGEGG